MRFRVPTLAAALLACTVASASSAEPAPRPSGVVAVLDFQSHLAGDGAAVDPVSLADRVRRVAQEAIPGLKVISRDDLHALLPDLEDGCVGECAVRAGRDVVADLVVTGDLFREGESLRLSLELRETREGEVVNAATVHAPTGDELVEAAAKAAAGLFQPLATPDFASGDAHHGEPAAFAIASAAPPLPPGPLGAVPDGLTVDYDVDADVLVRYDQARTADAAGIERPEEAAEAWKALAGASGANPFRALASERAKAWDRYVSGKRAFVAQKAVDSSHLRKVLPLRWVSEWVKLALVERYAKAYGAENAARMLPPTRLPALREKATLAFGCGANEADKCVTLARFADEGNEPSVAAAYLDRACGAGSAQACAEAGGRFLTPPVRDVARALSALRRGCEARGAEACARLARVYEEGDGAKVDLATASDLRDKACAAGDGSSCRRLACLIDTSANAAAKERAQALWSQGCAAGDAQSCALVRAAQSARGAQPASDTGTTKPPPPPDADAATSTRAYALERRQSLGIGLLTVGTVLGTGAALIAFDGVNPSRRGRPFADRRFDQRIPVVAYVLGAGAAISAVSGISLLLSKPDPDPPRKVTVGIAPGAVLLAGPLP